MQLHPVEGILDNGIALPDAAKFFETESGNKYMKEQSLFVSVGAGDAIWIPYGWLVAPMVAPLISGSSEAGQKDTCEEAAEEKKSSDLSFLVHVPFFAPKLAQALPQRTRQAIMQWSHDHLFKSKGQRMFTERFALYERFVKDM